jgi:hypothetical protein
MAVVVAVGSSVQQCVSNPKEDLHQHLSLLVRQWVSSVRDVAFHHVSSELVFSPWKEGCRRCIIAMTLSVPCTLVFCRALVRHPVQVPPFGSWRDQEHRYRVLAIQTHVRDVAFHHVSSELFFSPWKEGCRRCIIAMTLSVPCTLVFCRALVGHPVQVPPFGSWRDQEHRYRVLAKQTHVNEEYNPNNPHDTERFFQCDKVPSRIELVFDGKASLRKKG